MKSTSLKKRGKQRGYLFRAHSEEGQLSYACTKASNISAAFLCVDSHRDAKLDKQEPQCNLIHPDQDLNKKNSQICTKSPLYSLYTVKLISLSSRLSQNEGFKTETLKGRAGTEEVAQH